MVSEYLIASRLEGDCACVPRCPRDEALETKFPVPQVTSALLPFELYRPIVEVIADRTTLLSLCLTSRTFKFEAQRVLYDSVTSLSMNSHLTFLRTIAEVNQLALLVHTYHLPYLDDVIHSACSSTLSGALRGMINLRELFITSTLNTSYNAGPFIFNGCKFQLEALYLFQYVDGGAFFSFLTAQRKLRKLEVYLDSQRQPPPSIVCPQLASLQGNRATLETLLPNRQISNVIWNPDCFDARRSMSHLSEPLQCLKILSFQGCYLRPSLRAIVDHLQALEFLELVALHVGEIEDICKISSLRTLVLTDAFSLYTWERRVSIVSPVFKSCHRLEYIDIESVHDTDSHKLYQRWACPQGSKAPVMLGLFEKDFVRQPFCSI